MIIQDAMLISSIALAVMAIVGGLSNKIDIESQRKIWVVAWMLAIMTGIK